MSPICILFSQTISVSVTLPTQIIYSKVKQLQVHKNYEDFLMVTFFYIIDCVAFVITVIKSHMWKIYFMMMMMMEICRVLKFDLC